MTGVTPPTLVSHRDPDRTVVRLTGDDDLFVRMDRALRVPLANQVIWRLHEPIDRARFTQIGARLAHTGLNRTLRRNGIPFARDAWIDAGPHGGRVRYDPREISDDGVLDWVDECATTEFDLAAGPVWQFSAARLRSGGGVVVLTTSHAVGDGWAGVRDVVYAVDEQADAPSLPSTTPSLTADLRDALTQIGCITTNLVSLIADRTRRAPAATSAGATVTSQSIPRPAESSPAAPPTVTPPLVIASFSTTEWNRIAEHHDGTANSLFIAITTGLIVAAGRATYDDVVRVVVPMSRPDGPDDDPRANVTTGLHLDVPAELSRRRDLGAIRRLAKLMYQSARESPATAHRLAPLVQSLPDAALLRLNRDAATPLAVASNVGEVDPRFAHLGGLDVKDVALRSVPQNVDEYLLRRLRGGIACWRTVSGETITLAVGSTDPDHVPHRTHLQSLLDAECARWGLTPSHW